MEKTVGKQSIRFEEAIHLISAASIAGKKEGEGPLGKLFDKISADPCFGMETWEEAESAMQRSAVETALEKAGMRVESGTFPFWRGSSGSAHSHLLRGGRAAGFLFRPLRGLLHLRRVPGPGGYDCGGGLRRSGDGRHQQPFRRGRKAVPFSTGVRKPAAAVCHLDSDRGGRFSSEQKRRQGADPRSDDRKGCGLRRQGFS